MAGIRNRYWVALLVLAATCALWLSFRSEGAPVVSNDSYQYLDAAANIASGKCLCVRIAHFDEQVAFGRMPVPFTHFPPGYPLLIAIVSMAGAPPEIAAYMVSAAGFLLTVWLTWELAITLGAKPAAAGPLCLLWIVHASTLTFAASVGGESIFAAALTGTAVLMVRDVRAGSRGTVRLIAIGATAAAAYWLRYAGLFALPVAALYIAWNAWRSPASRRSAALALATEGALVAAIIVHNIVMSGSWKGGFSGGAAHSLRAVLVDLVKAGFHLVFGDRVVARVDLLTVTFAVSLLVACSAWRTNNRRAAKLPTGSPGAFLCILMLAAAYVAGIVLVALTSIAADLARYILPVYPLALATLAALFSIPGTRTQLIAVAAMAASVVAIQSRSLVVEPPKPPHAIVASEFEQTFEGDSIGKWLARNIEPSETLIAVNGQAVHYLLDHPVVTLIEPEYSSRRMDEASIHALMQRFATRYLVLFPGDESYATRAQYSIPFLRGLNAGTVPAWLRLAASTRNTAVFECGDCGRVSPQAR